MAKSKSSYGRGTGIPNPVDVHVGARLRQRRTLLGMKRHSLTFVFALIAATNCIGVHNAYAGWRQVENAEPHIRFTAPGLADLEPRVISHVDDWANGRSENVCWGDPKYEQASACITHQRYKRRTVRFTYLKPNNIAAIARPLKPLDKEIEKEIREYQSKVGSMPVARFRVREAEGVKDCFAFSRYWSSNRQRIIGWYCAPSGRSLSDDTIARIVSSIAIQ